MKVLEVQNISKMLSRRQIINGISFDVNEGEIFGFLGPNGAGKTTTIRMIVGFIAPNTGSIKVMGHDIQKERPEALKHIGAVVENPELYTYLSGRENLMQIARVRNVDKSYVDEIVKQVELDKRIDDKVKKYSLGMKQRLGLAASLIGKPKLLILDEPTNGLDPSGIIDFRRIVRNVARSTGAAVFISSHILSEIQMVCDRVAFINHGEIQAVESLNEDNSEDEHENAVLVCRDKEKCRNALKLMDNIYEFSNKEETFYLNLKKDSIPNVIFELAKKGISIDEIYKKQVALEERYMELVEGGKRA
jgi:ABC-2 type transport system ATP-binding protein